MRRQEMLGLILSLFLLFSTLPAGAQEKAVGKTVSVNGFEMYYETLGEGEPLLLVHGWSGNAAYFAPLLPELSNHYRLIIPELRGHGQSTNPDGNFSTFQAAKDVASLLDQLGLSEIRALGASAGGLTLIHMALQRPEALNKMILVGVGTRFPQACRESMLAADADGYPPEWWEVMRERHPRGDPQIRELVEYLRQLAASEVDVDFTRAALSSLTTETFIVQGDSDWCFPPSLAAELHDGIPDASLWVIPKGEHVPILGPRAPTFLEHALAFFRGEPTGESGSL